MKSTAVKTTGTEFEFSAAKALFKTFFRDLQTSLSEWLLAEMLKRLNLPE